jgi:hypothetical protein
MEIDEPQDGEGGKPEGGRGLVEIESKKWKVRSKTGIVLEVLSLWIFRTRAESVHSEFNSCSRSQSIITSCT